MKPAITIPIKTNNTRLPRKTFLPFGHGYLKLYEHTFTKLIDLIHEYDVYIDTSDEIIKKEAKNSYFNVIDRPDYLNADDITGNELLQFEMDYIPNDIILQTHITLPFLENNTIMQAIEILSNNIQLDSLLPVYRIYNRFWKNTSEPINHVINGLSATQDLNPVYCEVGFYVFRRNAFLKEKTRVTRKRLMYFVDKKECIDIDDGFDFAIANSYYKLKDNFLWKLYENKEI